MALNQYDEAIAAKLARWIPTTSKLRILKPNETKRLIATEADDTNDRPIKLPIIALSRSSDIELLQNAKSQKSFIGLKMQQTADNTVLMNVIPIKLQYQMDIYTKTYEEAAEYVRQFLFKLINNPVLKILIPYNGSDIEQIANIRVLNTISDTSDIAERLFPGQFTRWTIQFEVQDANLYDIPVKTNWKLVFDDSEIELNGSLEIADNLTTENVADIIVEPLPVKLKK